MFTPLDLSTITSFLPQIYCCNGSTSRYCEQDRILTMLKSTARVFIPDLCILQRIGRGTVIHLLICCFVRPSMLSCTSDTIDGWMARYSCLCLVVTLYIIHPPTASHFLRCNPRLTSTDTVDKYHHSPRRVSFPKIFVDTVDFLISWRGWTSWCMQPGNWMRSA